MMTIRNLARSRFSSHPWHGHLLRIFLLWIVIIAAYSNSFRAGLVFDNAPIIAQDSRIRAASSQNVGLIFSEEYWFHGTPSGLYRPLTTLSYLLNYSTLGNRLNSAGYHIINLLLHLLNAILLYALILKFLHLPSIHLPALPLPAESVACAISAIWAVHPLLTESVTNIVGRADLLAGFAILAGLHAYARLLDSRGRRAWLWLAALAVAQTIGIFSKENAAVLPVLLAAWSLNARRAPRSRFLAAAAVLIPLALFALLRFRIHTELRIDPAENPLVQTGFLAARITAVGLLGKLALLFLWPARLSADYSFAAIPVFTWTLTGATAFALLCVVLAAAAIIFAWRSRHNRPSVFFLAAFFFVTLAPTANIFFPIGTIFAERFAYLPAIPLTVLAVYAASSLAARFNQDAIARVCLIVLCVLLAARTYARNLDWYDQLSLWSSAAAVSPASARAHNNLGAALLPFPARLSSAITEFRIALQIRPDYPDAHYNLASAFARVPGHSTEAVAEYRVAIRRRPDYPEAHFNLANVLAATPSSIPEAIAEYRAAAQLRPDDPAVHNNLGSLLSQLPGRLPDAIAEYRASLSADPDYAKAHNNLANTLAGVPGREAESLAHFEAAIASDPNFADAHFNLANLYAQIPGRRANAVAEYQAAIRLRPDFAEAHANLGAVLIYFPNRRADAISELRTALSLRPDPSLRRFVEKLTAAPSAGGLEKHRSN